MTDIRLPDAEETARAAELIPHDVLPDRYAGDKPFGTAISYLYASDDNSFSAMPKLPTDEIYHFYLGDPVELIVRLTRPGEALRML